MQKIKFDFEATKERIYAPNSNVPIGAPVDRNGNIANDGNACGIVLCKETENEKYWVRYNLVVMVAGYCDIIDAQEIWGDEYSAEAIAAMSDIVFCDDHKIPGGGGGGVAMVVVNCNIDPQTMEIELTDDAIEVLDKINTDFNAGTFYPVVANLIMSFGGVEAIAGINMSGYSINSGKVGLVFSGIDVAGEIYKCQVLKIWKVDGLWVAKMGQASIPQS